MHRTGFQHCTQLSKLTLDIADDQVFWTDHTGHIIYANRAACRKTGYSPDELLAMSVCDLSPDFPSSHWPAHWDELKSKGSMTFESTQRHSDGLLRDVEIMTNYVCHDGLEFTSAFVRDITERLRIEKALQRDVRERTSMVQSLHEQQTRLNRLANELLLAEERERRRIASGLHDQIVQGLAIGKILISGKLADQLPDTCRTVHERVRDILTSAIRDTRTLMFDLSPPLLYEVGLPPALEELGERLGQEHDFRFELQTTGEHGALSEIHRVTLYQILRELLLNIVKHACASQVRLTCDFQPGRLDVIVQDNGTGFDAADTFNNPSVSSGSGYGLFSVKQRITLLGGDLEIRSNPGHGACILFWIPTAPPDDTAAKTGTGTGT